MKKAHIATLIIWSCLIISMTNTTLVHTLAKNTATQKIKSSKPNSGEQQESNLKSLYEAHQWFKLRDAVQAEKASAFYRGAVACAFNDAEQADKELQAVIKSDPKSAEAIGARELLTYVYQRAGQNRLALSQIELMMAEKPDKPDLKNGRAFFSVLTQYPDQSVIERSYSLITCYTKDENLFIPISINGKQANYIVDTGANFSAICESEAKRLGLTIVENSAKGTDSTGGQISFRTAVADELKVGKVRLRNVVFLVYRDNQQPFVDLQPGEGGVIGLPVLLAFNNIRWSADGKFEIGFPPPNKNGSKANICFEGAMPVTEAEYRRSKITLVLDTGASTTHLWPSFAKEFMSVIKGTGKKEKSRITGVGHSVKVEAITFPEVTLKIGGLDTFLRPATVQLKETDSYSRWYHGRLGLDLLSQARVVTIDFTSMTLSLE